MPITGHHYDYKNQAWTLNGRYIACEHPSCHRAAGPTNCYGTIHEGEIAPPEHLPSAEELAEDESLRWAAEGEAKGGRQ